MDFEKKYYLHFSGENYGPYSMREIIEWTEANGIPAEYLIWADEKWQNLNEFIQNFTSLSKPEYDKNIIDNKKKETNNESILAELDFKNFTKKNNEQLSSFNRKVKLALAFIISIGIFIWFIFSSGMIKSSLNVKQAAELKQIQVILYTTFSNDSFMYDNNTGNYTILPQNINPAELPERLKKIIIEAGLMDEYSKNLQYISDGKQFKILIPIEKSSVSYVVGDPFMQKICYWYSDSGPINWNNSNKDR